MHAKTANKRIVLESGFELHRMGHLPDAYLKQIIHLRLLAWSSIISDFPKRNPVLTDSFDLVATHWIIKKGDEIVAAARLSIHFCIEDVPDAEVYLKTLESPVPTPIGAFNRMVVHPAFRRRGFSYILDSERIKYARENGCRCCVGAIVAESGEKRLLHLQEIGFQLAGNPVPEPKGHFLEGRTTQAMIAHLSS